MAVRKRLVIPGTTADSGAGGSERSLPPISREGYSTTKRYAKVFLFFIALAYFIWAYPSPVDPIAFSYSNESAPELTGPLAVNDVLKSGKRLFENEIIGPEAFATDKEGNIYTGLVDGRIIKINMNLQSFKTIIRTGKDSDECKKGSPTTEEYCGRPLGMHFNSKQEKELYVLDSSLGVIKVNVEDKSIDILIGKSTSAVPVNLLNDLVELPNGSLLITDSSLKFSRHENRMESLECRSNGQLLIYNPNDGSLHVLMKDLFFPNGVCLSHDGQSALLVETTRARILRYHLYGSKAGTTEIFSENLPVWPDNISPSSTGGYWLGSAFLRNRLTDVLANFVFVRSFIAKFHLLPLIEAVLPVHSVILELNENGQVVRSFHDKGGSLTSSTSHILELDNRTLLVGSYHAPYLVKVNI